MHLVNYRTDQPFQEVTVRLRLPEERKATGVMLASPDRKDDLAVQFNQEENVVTFTVPKIDIYEIAAVAME